MKHQQAILNQRLINMQSAIKSANVYLTDLQYFLSADWESEKLKEEVEEIASFLNWASRQ